MGYMVTVLCHYPSTIAEAVQRADLKVGLFYTQNVGMMAELHAWNKHAPVPAGGVPALPQAALSPSPESRPKICTCIAYRMGNLPLSD